MNAQIAFSSFERHWSPQDYLGEFYSPLQINEDELDAIRHQIDFAKRQLHKDQLILEFGAGPTVHRAIAVAPYVSEIHIADYLPQNLSEVQRWVYQQEGQHNWDLYVSYALQCEGIQNPSAEQIEQRKFLTRKKITTLIKADASQAQPLGNSWLYSHVYSGFCADSAISSKDSWRSFMRNISSLIAPGGTFWTGALRQAAFYNSGPHQFPSANVTEEEMWSVLALDFLPSSIVVEIRELPSLKQHGYEGIILAHARKE